ncbi:MAG: pentapeptide repeat-containing protein, partial [Bifidobacteriaceae bacterium]|nr:pentapeptide repeat-containing protein [Bifidobacteriaceae bacterium]
MSRSQAMDALESSSLPPLPHTTANTLFSLADDAGAIPESRVLATFFPGSPLDRQQENLCALVDDLNQALGQTPCELRVAWEQSAGYAGKRRYVIEGLNPDVLAAVQYSGRSAVVPVQDIPTEAKIANPRPLSVAVIRDGGNTPCTLTQDLKTNLTARANIVLRFYDLSEPEGLASPADFARDNGPYDVAVWLLTSRLAADPALTRNDVEATRAIAVLAEPMDLTSRGDVLGFAIGSIFTQLAQSFQEFQGAMRQKFVQEVCRAILVRPDVAETPAPRAEDTYQTIERYSRHQMDAGESDRLLRNTVGRRVALESENEQKGSSTGDPRVLVLEALVDWACNDAPGARQHCVLLGDMGSGKTTNSRLLAKELLRLCKADPTERIPIYLDLREVDSTFVQSSPELEALIDHALRSARAAGIQIRAHQLLNLVRSGNAVLIFDGLDEILVHIPRDVGHRLTALLWWALGSEEEQASLKRRSKLILTCRTHHFRETADETAFLTGQRRRGPEPSDYLALELMQWDRPRIQEYLERNLTGTDTAQAMETIESVHNLSELAARPVNLEFIAEQLGDLTARSARGETVHAITIYSGMARRWLKRDSGKHTLSEHHKLRLMEDLAAQMAVRGEATWSIDDIDQWLDDNLAGPEMEKRYRAISREILEEDLRTATYLVRLRDEDCGDHFRFAHTSLREYFTARYLFRALREPDVKPGWSLPTPSRETLEFLGQLLAVARPNDLTECQSRLKQIQSGGDPHASKLALTYALSAHRNGHPCHSLAGANLTGADLRQWDFSVPGGLNLKQARFDGADLLGAVFRDCDLTGASFRGADLTRTRILGGRASQIDLSESNLSGSVWRHIDLDGAQAEGATLRSTQWLSCPNIPKALGSRRGSVCVAPAVGMDASRKTGPGVVFASSRHAGSVNAMAWSPDGTALATAGYDQTVRLWNPT